MSVGSRVRGANVLFSWFWRSPVAVAALLTGIAGTAVVERALAGLDEAQRIHAEVERLAVRIVAERSAGDYVSSGGASCIQVVDAGGGILVRTSIEPLPGSDQLRLRASVGEQQLEFMFAWLAGSTSPVFGRPLTVAAGAPWPAQWRAGLVEDTAALPTLECVGPPRANGSEAGRLLATDAGIALLRLAAGTDRDDHVLVVNPNATGPQRLAASGCVTVPGNLWIDGADTPLLLELADDLTLVVRGNVYLGRTVRVIGRGHLTIAAVGTPGSAFADLDGNGRWSPGDELRGSDTFAGPMEGAGSVYLGLPREGHGQLEFDLGLVVMGVLHVAVDTALVHGPVILHRGGVPMPGRTGTLVATGKRLPSLRRTALPGFATVGSPRPGPVLQLGGQPLYPARPAR